MDKPTLFQAETLIPLVLAEEAYSLEQASKSRSGPEKDLMLKKHKKLQKEWLNAVHALLRSPNAPRA